MSLFRLPGKQISDQFPAIIKLRVESGSSCSTFTLNTTPECGFCSFTKPIEHGRKKSM